MHENLAISTYLIPHMNFYLTFIDFFTIFNNMVLIVVRHEVSHFDSFVVVHELD